MACGQLCPYHGIHTLPASLPPAASVHRTMLSTPAAGWRFRRGGLPWRLHTCSCLASPLSSRGGEPEYVLNFTRLFFSECFCCSFFLSFSYGNVCADAERRGLCSRRGTGTVSSRGFSLLNREFLISATPSDFPILHPNSQRNCRVCIWNGTG